VCETLRREREREIRRLAEHSVQMQNELSDYQNHISSPEEMLRKHTDYEECPQYKKVQEDVRAFLEKMSAGGNAVRQNQKGGAACSAAMVK